MQRNKQPKIALVWTQFVACHVDRCIAVAQRLEGRAQVVAVEVAATSREYSAFPLSGQTGGAHKRTLFPGRSFDDVPRWRRFVALLGAVKGCRTVCIGVPYSELEVVVLSWVLRLLGKQVVLLSDSKFDDYPRASSFELIKAMGLSCFSGVIVGGSRGRDYFRFLGFRKRPVLACCDTVSIERIRAQAALHEGPAPGFGARDFVYVGRFVAEKNVSLLIDAYARYCQLEGGKARRLVLVGSGPLEAQLREEAAAKAPVGSVIFTGFLDGPQLGGRLASALGLMLVSFSETWGLVVNEALALGLPVITTQAPGSRDELVRNLVNGFVLENGSAEGLAKAMQQLGGNQAGWERMSAASLALAPRGDVAVFCDAVERLLGEGVVADSPQTGLVTR